MTENNNKAKILLISQNFYPEPTGIGKYNGEMMLWLAKQGYDCDVVTAYPYYPFWKVQAPYKNRWYKKETEVFSESGGSLTLFRCPSYVPSKPTGNKRIIQDMSFWSSKFWVVLKLVITKKKYDLIITVAPPFHLAFLGLLLKKYTGGKLLYHIQDLQIEAAQDLNIVSDKRLFNQLYKMEKGILSGADYISSISEGMIKKIELKAKRNVVFFPNWVDTSLFYPISTSHQLKSKWGYKPEDMVYLYSGAIGEKQGLEGILLAAEQLAVNNNIKFIICGTGPYKQKLIDQANEKGLKNVSFLPVQDNDVFNDFLNMADLHLIIQKANAGDLVMPSKLTTILAVGGVSVVTASEGTSLYKLVSKYNVGYIVNHEDPDLLAKTIASINKDGEYESKKRNARDYALKYLNIDNVMNQFTNAFLQ